MQHSPCRPTVKAPWLGVQNRLLNILLRQVADTLWMLCDRLFVGFDLGFDEPQFQQINNHKEGTTYQWNCFKRSPFETLRSFFKRTTRVVKPSLHDTFHWKQLKYQLLELKLFIFCFVLSCFKHLYILVKTVYFVIVE